MHLRKFSLDDSLYLQEYRYRNLTKEEIERMICDWNTKIYEGKYFEMFAAVEEQIVGMVSLYAHSKETVSIGVETFSEYRNCGYGSRAVELALSEAKNKGYKIATAQVQCDNLPSIAICNKVGFENNHSYVNKKGNRVYFFIKSLV